VRKATVSICWVYCGLDLAAEAEVTYSPGTPGQFYGPPEKCYPDDPPELIDILSLTLTEVGQIKCREEMATTVPTEIIELLEEAIYQMEPEDDGRAEYEHDLAKDYEMEKQWEKNNA
jgi:hypothetical protein